jgi:arsenate reductase (thioredoxin)
MSERVYNVLFLCTANSARSQMAESILNQLGRGRFAGYSAGSHPAPEPNPDALAYLRRNNIDTRNLRTKDWAEFAQPGAPNMDFVITVCDKAAGETCPIWPGQPMTAHWGVEDPVSAQGSEEHRQRAFAEAYHILNRRISIFLSLPLDKLDRLALQRELSGIGKVSS